MHGWLMTKQHHFLPIEIEVLEDINVFVLRTDIVARDIFVWILSPSSSFSIKDAHIIASSLWGVVSDKIWSQI